MSNSNGKARDLIAVGIGEALFDCFGDRSLLGGAPVNFAIHADQLLKSLGGKGEVVSCVGDDTLGQQLRAELSERGLSTRQIQTNSSFLTGTVQVSLDKRGEPDYNITENVAWDYLAINVDSLTLAESCRAVCFGTLAQRSSTSRRSIHQFLSSAKNALKVFDLNLRQDYFDAQVIEASFHAANVVKLNEEELDTACRLLNLAEAGVGNTEDRAFTLCRAFKLDALALTRGSRGTLLFTPERRIEGAVGTFPVSKDADSVGAGDGSCAALVSGLLLGLPLEHVLDVANKVGAYIASQPGATPQLPPQIVSLFRQNALDAEKPAKVEV